MRWRLHVVMTGQGRAGQGRAGQGRAGQGRAGQLGTILSMTWKARYTRSMIYLSHLKLMTARTAGKPNTI